MKKTLLFTAGVAATLFGGQAFAATGYLDASANAISGETASFGVDGDAYGATIGGAGSANMGDNFKFQYRARIAYFNEDDVQTWGQDGALGFYHQGESWLFGVSAEETHLNDTNLTELTGAAEVHYYLPNLTIVGGASYGSISESDQNVTSIGGGVRFFPSDTLRVEGSLARLEITGPGPDIQPWTASVGIESQIGDGPISLYGTYAHTDIDETDSKFDSLAIGVRYNWGGSLKDRDRKGPSTGGVAPGYLRSIFGVLN